VSTLKAVLTAALIEWGDLHPPEDAADHILAALRDAGFAARAATPDAADRLDVERLAQAIRALQNMKDGERVTEWDAETIAAEYERLVR